MTERTKAAAARREPSPSAPRTGSRRAALVSRTPAAQAAIAGAGRV